MRRQRSRQTKMGMKHNQATESKHRVESKIKLGKITVESNNLGSSLTSLDLITLNYESRYENNGKMRKLSLIKEQCKKEEESRP